MHWVYILKSEKDKGWYIGQTSNIDERIKEHNKGKVRSTKSRRPLKIIFHREFKDRSTAEKAEKYYKSGAGRIRLKKLFSEE